MATAVTGRLVKPEVWGGIECTVNRVADHYGDQLVKNGHAQRIGDLALFATLGIKALRYPVLWERTADIQGNVLDWTWPDERLGRLRELGIRPIVGLVHHGSGPPGTSLVQKSFATGLAAFAENVARRYPWVDSYTPVNEPLTTARFSALYGHWYPHGRSDRDFCLALVNQCRGIVLAMQAITEVNPAARLVQTENLEKIHSTRKLRYQANFENERRWLSIDLLLGRVDRHHALWNYLLDSGIDEQDLAWFVDHPLSCQVILGWNYYLTSERFLDQRLSRYPLDTHGGNGRERYADLEAVRVRGEGLTGLRGLLLEAWERYRLPLAVTEVHLGCHRESQVRWLLDAWNTVVDLQHCGIDIRAMTAWSLLGAYDWNSLCTKFDGFYEPGVFDLRGGTPRPTALAKAVSNIAHGTELSNAAVPKHGWWDLPRRLLYRPVFTGARSTRLPVLSGHQTSQLLILGATGTLGKAFAWACRERGLSHATVSRRELDITDREQVQQVLAQRRPWAVINAAGYVRVDAAEEDAENCHRVNAVGAAYLAAACAELELPLVTFSSDLVFDGGRQSPYIERDAVRPLCVYGRSKAEAEQQVLSIYPAALVIRTSAFFGPWDEHNFLTQSLRSLAAGSNVSAAEDWIVSPTYVPDLVHASLDLLVDGERGLWHLANSTPASWADFARMGAVEAGLDQQLVCGCSGSELRLAAPRPAFSALGSERGLHLPELTSAIRRYWQASQRSMFTAG
jgi:dTDP-4-dehydrorhamnose reductase